MRVAASIPQVPAARTKGHRSRAIQDRRLGRPARRSGPDSRGGGTRSRAKANLSPGSNLASHAHSRPGPGESLLDQHPDLAADFIRCLPQPDRTTADLRPQPHAPLAMPRMWIGVLHNAFGIVIASSSQTWPPPGRRRNPSNHSGCASFRRVGRVERPDVPRGRHGRGRGPHFDLARRRAVRRRSTRRAPLDRPMHRLTVTPQRAELDVAGVGVGDK